MPPATPRRRRARPVADAPIDSLLTRSEDLAKGWLLALLEQAPLDDAPGILAADLSRDGPRVCDAVLRAIADDTDLRRLEAGGALRALAGRAGELAGATAPGAISRAVDALGAVIWSALRDELRAPDPDLVVELSERLTLVIELVRAAALDRAGAMAPGGSGPAGGTRGGGPERGLSAVPQSESGSRSEPTRPEPGGRPEPGERSAPGERAGEALPEPPQRPWPDIRDPTSPEPPPAPEALWVGALDDEIRALWVGALDDEIRRAGASPLSLLLTELEDVERVAAVETSAKASATFGEFAQAVRSVVRRQDILVCETDTRAWIIARDTARAGAQALGTRIADAVGAVPPWRGAPLVASVGTAVLGEDGRSAAELIESAEVARFGFAAGGDEVDDGED